MIDQQLVDWLLITIWSSHIRLAEMSKQTRQIYKKTLLGERSHIADNDSNDDTVNSEGRGENLGN